MSQIIESLVDGSEILAEKSKRQRTAENQMMNIIHELTILADFLRPYRGAHYVNGNMCAAAAALVDLIAEL
jgi:hypothetical protein